MDSTHYVVFMFIFVLTATDFVFSQAQNSTVCSRNNWHNRLKSCYTLHCGRNAGLCHTNRGTPICRRVKDECGMCVKRWFINNDIVNCEGRSSEVCPPDVTLLQCPNLCSDLNSCQDRHVIGAPCRVSGCGDCHSEYLVDGVWEHCHVRSNPLLPNGGRNTLTARASFIPPTRNSGGVRQPSIARSVESSSVSRSAGPGDIAEPAVCPVGVQELNCPNLCARQQCDNYPNALCRVNRCGSCRAEYYIGDTSVNCRGQKCEDGVTYFHTCNSCAYNYCHRYPQAQCRMDACGKCRAEYWLNGRQVNCSSQNILDPCPNNQPRHVCDTNVCRFDTCPKNSSITCVTDNCGGCRPLYIHKLTNSATSCTGYWTRYERENKGRLATRAEIRLARMQQRRLMESQRVAPARLHRLNRERTNSVPVVSATDINRFREQPRRNAGLLNDGNSGFVSENTGPIDRLGGFMMNQPEHTGHSRPVSGDGRGADVLLEEMIANMASAQGGGLSPGVDGPVLQGPLSQPPPQGARRMEFAISAPVIQEGSQQQRRQNTNQQTFAKLETLIHNLDLAIRTIHDPSAANTIQNQATPLAHNNRKPLVQTKHTLRAHKQHSVSPQASRTDSVITNRRNQGALVNGHTGAQQSSSPLSRSKARSSRTNLKPRRVQNTQPRNTSRARGSSLSNMTPRQVNNTQRRRTSRQRSRDMRRNRNNQQSQAKIVKERIASSAARPSRAIVKVSEPVRTKAPTTTTTTKRPTTTTRRPTTTTRRPTTTTRRPTTTTTKAPVTTTKAPVTTTKAPVTTTKAPVTTTKAPVTTTKAPVTKAPARGKPAKSSGTLPLNDLMFPRDFFNFFRNFGDSIAIPMQMWETTTSKF